VPRTVCKLADLSLLSAFAQQRPTVEIADAEQAIKQAEQAVKPRKERNG
jgi:hypothetical protein